MGLHAVQTFMATYMRDQDFRRCLRAGELSEADYGEGLSSDEVKLISQIEFDKLEARAESILTERQGRTAAVFSLFLEHLGRYVDVEKCYREYDRVWKTGWWRSRSEIRRFEAFAFEYVVTHQLPEYLIDLLRLCAQSTVVAETPKGAVPVE